MTLAARLALQTGAAVVLARCERLPWGRGFVTYFEPWPAPQPKLAADPSQEPLELAVQHINRAMEHTIAQCPQQYLWGYGRYKQPRADAATTEGAAA